MDQVGEALGAPHADAVDRYLDLWLRGVAPPLPEYLAAHPELGGADRAQLERLARALSPGGEEGGVQQSVDQYRLLGRLGAGGMGVVYRAEDSVLGREVALKLLRPDLAKTSDHRGRLEREARVLASLSHPNIVTIHEAHLDGERPYLVMELLSGQSLDGVLAAARSSGRPLGSDAVARIALQVARALQAAHAVGILHRDVKPSNVQLCEGGHVKLLDFGLAAVADGASLSETGRFHGTLGYVSPEQINGRSSDLDARSDLWSLGVLMYEALSGRLPFEGRDAAGLLRSIAWDEPIGLRRLVPALSRDLETIAIKCLSKDRARRYRDAEELGADLLAFLERRPIRARPSGALTRVWSWSRRRPATASFAASLGLILVLGPIGYALLTARHAAQISVERDKLVQRTRELDEVAAFQARMLSSVIPVDVGEQILASVRSRAQEGWLRASQQEASTEQGWLDQLDARLASVNAADLANDVLSKAVLDPAAERLATDFVDPLVVRTELELRLSEAYRTVGNSKQALALAERAAVARQEALGPGHPRTKVAARQHAVALHAVGRHADAEAELLVLWEQGAPADADERLEWLRTGVELVSVREALDQLQTAEPMAKTLYEEIRDTHGGSELFETAANNYATVLASLAKHSEALALLEEVVARRRERVGASHPDTLVAANNLALLMAWLDRHADAIQWLEDAYRRAVDTLGAAHPVSLRLANNLGGTLNQAFQPERAEPYLRAVVEARLKSLGAAHGDTARAMSNLGNLLRGVGRLSEAALLLRQAADASRTAFGMRHTTTMSAYNNLSFLLEEQGDLEGAASIARLLVAEGVHVFPDGHPGLAAWWHNLAGLERKLGRIAEALDLSTRASASAEKALGATHTYTLAFQRERARCLALSGEPGSALELLDRQWLTLAEAPADLAEYRQIAAGLALELAEAWAADGSTPGAQQAVQLWRTRAREEG